FRDQVWNLGLLAPGASVGLEIYGRWPRGVPFTTTPTAKDVPALDAVLLVIAGQVELKIADHQYLLKAPPGRALFHWDSTNGPAPGPDNLAEAPAWANNRDLDDGTEVGRRRQKAIGRFRQLLVEKSLDAALDEFSASDDHRQRRYAIYSMG